MGCNHKLLQERRGCATQPHIRTLASVAFASNYTLHKTAVVHCQHHGIIFFFSPEMFCWRALHERGLPLITATPTVGFFLNSCGNLKCHLPGHQITSLLWSSPLTGRGQKSNSLCVVLPTSQSELHPISVRLVCEDWSNESLIDNPNLVNTQEI